jgi:hypothetical protein
MNAIFSWQPSPGDARPSESNAFIALELGAGTPILNQEIGDPLPSRDPPLK